jgi:hypothetical protein
MATEYNQMLIQRIEELQELDAVLTYERVGAHTMAINHMLSDYPLVWAAMFEARGEGEYDDDTQSVTPHLDPDDPEHIAELRRQAIAARERIEGTYPE